MVKYRFKADKVPVLVEDGRLNQPATVERD